MQNKENGQPSRQQSNGDNIKDGNFTCKVILFVVLTALVIGFIVYSFKVLNYENIEKLNYPVSSSNKICNIDYALTFPYLYIDLTASAPKYYCVDHCPSGWNQFIITSSQGNEIYCSAQEKTNIELGGICWSAEKEEAMKQKGWYDQLNFKENILGQFKKILIILITAFLISLIIIALFYCLPQSVNFFSSVVLAFLLLGGLIILLSISKSAYYSILIITTIAIISIFIISIICGIQKLSESSVYTTSTLDKINQGPTSSIFLKSILYLLIFNTVNFIFLVFILFQYISLVSSDKQEKMGNQVFFTVDKQWWKYILLILEWFLVSNIIKQLYSFCLVRLGYQINKSMPIKCICFTFNNLINIVAFSFILMLLWLPLRIIELFKPDGAIIRKDQDQTCCHKVTKAAYCCCGYFINKVHKYTFNPYLILAFDQEFNDIQQSLRFVQESYHQHDDRYDKSSLWIYRLSNYIIIIILSILCMGLLNRKQIDLASAHLLFFYVISGILSVEISKLNMNYWSSLIQVTEFIAINQS